jgi:hypothetical protein
VTEWAKTWSKRERERERKQASKEREREKREKAKRALLLEQSERWERERGLKRVRESKDRGLKRLKERERERVKERSKRERGRATKRERGKKCCVCHDVMVGGRSFVCCDDASKNCVFAWRFSVYSYEEYGTYFRNVP